MTVSTVREIRLKKKTLTPAVNQDLGAVRGSDSLGVLDGLPRQLGEGLAEHSGATLLLAVSVLLAVRGIPDPVNKQVGHIEEGQEIAVPVVSSGVVVGKIDCAVAVTQGHTSQVPEDQHKAPFFIVHIPENVS